MELSCIMHEGSLVEGQEGEEEGLPVPTPTVALKHTLWGSPQFEDHCFTLIFILIFFNRMKYWIYTKEYK